MSERLLDAREVAEWLGVPVSWVRESTRSGAMPCVELGRYRRYERADIEAWLAQCKQPARTIEMRHARVRQPNVDNMALVCHRLGDNDEGRLAQ